MGLVEVEIAAEPPDSEAASELLERYYAELDARFPGGFDPDRAVAVAPAELFAPRGAFLVARIDGHPLGCGSVRKLDGATSEIKRMWIDPVARGRGLGRSLLAALEAKAIEFGCRSIRLDTNAHLTEAVGLYRSSGYLEVRAYNDNPYAAHWFEKSLT
jgi:GNAT superfamily N-acetyltransferase